MTLMAVTSSLPQMAACASMTRRPRPSYMVLIGIGDSISRLDGLKNASVNNVGALDLTFTSGGHTYSFGINPIGALVLYNNSTHEPVKTWQ